MKHKILKAIGAYMAIMTAFMIVGCTMFHFKDKAGNEFVYVRLFQDGEFETIEAIWNPKTQTYDVLLEGVNVDVNVEAIEAVSSGVASGITKGLKSGL